MSTQPIDYDAVAKQYGAISSQPAMVDYDAVAKQYGAISSQPAPPEEKSGLSKLWDFASKGLISGDTILNTVKKLSPGLPDQKPGESGKDYFTRIQNKIDMDHPYLQGMAAGIAGAFKDTADQASSFTSPVSIGLAGAGAAGKIPGAVGKVAKAVTGLAGAGFAAKGAPDVVNNTPAALQGDPEAAQRALMGGAMVAGGAAGTAEASKGALAEFADKNAPRIYKGALKASPASYTTPEVNKMVNTALENNIPVSADGASRLSGLIQDLGQKIKARIAADPMATVNKYKVTSRLSGTAQRFSNQVNPESDLAAISNSGNEFLRNQPNEIPAAAAQDLKQGTYQQISSKNYGELKSAEMESQKALARGIKEELEIKFPQIKSLNAKQGDFFGLDESLQRAVRRIENRDVVSLGDKVTGAVGTGLGMATGSIGEAGAIGVATTILQKVITDPAIQSKIAIAMNHASKGTIPYSAARARVLVYANALRGSQGANGGQSNQQ